MIGSSRLAAAGPPGPRLFLDTADAAAWAEWLPVGLFHGVTTNPTLLQRAGIRCTLPALRALVGRAFDLGAAEIQVQTWGDEPDALSATGRALADIDRRIVVKVPITRAGVQAATSLVAEGVRVTLTGLYAPHQALTAAATGATYAAPYLGRMNDAGRDGHDAVAAMQEIVAGTGAAMRILVASLRSVDDLVRLARRGVDTFTIAPALAAALFDEALTDAAIADFEAAARAMGAAPATGRRGVPS